MTGTPAGPVERWGTVAASGSFEETAHALDEIVEWLESGGHGLDDAVAAYEVGTRVAQRSQRLLAEAELRVSQLTVDLEDLDAEVRRDLADSPGDDEPGDDPDDPAEPPF